MPSPPARSRQSTSTTSASKPRASATGSTASIGLSSTVTAPALTSPRASFARHTPRAARKENGPRSTESVCAAPAAAAHSGSTPGPPPERQSAATPFSLSPASEPARAASAAGRRAFFATSFFAARAYARTRSASPSATSDVLGAASSARFLKCASTPARLGSSSNWRRFKNESRAFGANVGRQYWSSTSHSGPDMVWRQRASVASRSSARRAARSLAANARRFASSCATTRPRASSLSACATARSSRTPSKVAACAAPSRRASEAEPSIDDEDSFCGSDEDSSGGSDEDSFGGSDGSDGVSCMPTPVMSLAHVSSEAAAACHSPAVASAFPSR